MKLRKILYTPVEAPEQEQASQAFHHHPQGRKMAFENSLFCRSRAI